MPPLFILSFRHRDELMRAATEAGWQPIAARRAANAEARFLASGASVALIDARGALEEGLESARSIGEAAEANAGALLVLLSRNDADSLGRFHELGATHFLVSPFSEAQLAHAMRFAARHAERVAGDPRSGRRAAGTESDSWRWRPGTRSVELSPALARKAGLGEEDQRRLSLMELFRRLDPAGRRSAREAIDRLKATGQPTAFAHGDSEDEGARIAHHMRREEGEVVGRTEAISAASEGGRGRDSLTGMRDGRAARAWLARRLDSGEEVAAILVSVSRFDAVNAAFGRASGDSAMQAVARRIERLVEGTARPAMVARIAGAEFALLLAGGVGEEEARLLAEQALESIARPLASGGHVVSLAARSGFAFSREGEDPAGLLRRASAALAEARGAESGTARMWREGTESDGAAGQRLEVDLRRALDQDRIEIRFQPQVSVTSGRILGVEALARWIHPDHGELGAGTLFGVAERSDFLAQLSEHVQRKAIAEAAAWEGPLERLRLAVNVTAADLGRPGFCAQFLAMVAESGFDPARLTVEVTESGLIEDLGGAADRLAQLRAGGLRVAIDDFGTGYSSLAYLKALPLDYLKLDRRLSQDLAGSPRDRIVVRGVIDMARSLGLGVIAEGVETEEQLGLLAQEGCTLYQGFLCSPPVDSAALARLVEDTLPA